MSYLDVEVGEEAQEHERIEAHGVSQNFWVVAVDKEKLSRMQKDDHKLDHLHSGQILFPPQVLLILGSH